MLQLVFIAYVLLVIFLSLIPLPSTGGGVYKDKIAHFIMYAGMASLAYVSVRSMRKKLYFFVLILLLGVSLEFFQMYIPGRNLSLFDIAANTAGVFSGFLICWILAKFSGSLTFDGEHYTASND